LRYFFFRVRGEHVLVECFKLTMARRLEKAIASVSRRVPDVAFDVTW
jgi:hypothetical protein